MEFFDGFLKIDNLKGESQDHSHKGEFDIESFSWGMSQTGVQATGGGGGAGKVAVEDFFLTKRIDLSSPILMLACANGTHFKRADFVARKAAGSQPLEYLKITLWDVLVSSYKPHANPNLYLDDNHDRLPVDEFSLNFARVEYSYKPQGAHGKADGGPIIAGWDVKANKDF
jgi:type VI secretion system secreted protein Hcp